ncbi:hypothetical protein E2C01_038927 [Portunus trituberculatus]|uniref:Uncharacterized protein n=1 Tax=Portunus trituberculatus TaxID=210409 RepID=A0A5B7FLD2_PORTR|nr:hypothetical protein [Portunus trituberculatus]
MCIKNYDTREVNDTLWSSGEALSNVILRHNTGTAHYRYTSLRPTVLLFPSLLLHILPSLYPLSPHRKKRRKEDRGHYTI